MVGWVGKWWRADKLNENPIKRRDSLLRGQGADHERLKWAVKAGKGTDENGEALIPVVWLGIPLKN